MVGAPQTGNDGGRADAPPVPELSDTPSDQSFRDLLELARDVFGVPIALITLVDGDRHWCEASAGLDTAELAGGGALLAFTTLEDDVVVIEDAHADPRVSGDPLVAGPLAIRFLAGAPLITSAGRRLGSFCIMDRARRTLDPEGWKRLARFASIAIRMVELRTASNDREASRENERRLRRLLSDAIDALPDGFALYDASDRLVLFNKTYVDIYASSAPAIREGASFEEIIRYGLDRGQYPEASDHPDGVDGWLAERLYRHSNPSGPLEQEIPDGRWLRIWETKLPTGEIVGLRVDITWQKKLSSALQDLQWLAGAELPNDARRDARFLLIARRATGLPRALLLARDTEGDGLFVSATLGVDLKVGEKVDPSLVDGTGSGRFGITRDVLVEGAPAGLLLFGALDTTTLLPIQRDIASIMADWIGMDWSRRKVVDILREAQGTAEEGSRAKSRFLAMMSHEIRTPLNGVLGAIGLLDDGSLDADRQQLVRTARTSAATLMSLVNDVLDVSKLEAGRLELELAPMDPRKVVDDIITLLEPQASQEGLSLAARFSETLPTRIAGDAGRLRQVLINLVGNAIKFTRRGGIHIAVDILSEPKVADETSDRMMRFQVTDTGVGISKDDQARLFDEFWASPSASNRATTGTGLGLAICRRIVTMMGGRIDVESELGKGSCFWFEIPLLPVDEETVSRRDREISGPVPAEVEVSLTDRRLLVAEDNSANQLIIKTLLERRGAQVDVVADGAEAVQAVEARPYDLVLMDINMPEMDGIEATREIRAQGRVDLPIIAMTAHVMPDDRETLLAMGLDDYVAKPIQIHEISAVLSRWLATGDTARGEEREKNGMSDRSQFDEEEVIRLSVLEELVRESGLDIVVQVIDLFDQECERRLAAMSNAAFSGGQAVISSNAHALKSSAASLGAIRFSKLCASLEREGDAAQGALIVRELVRSRPEVIGRLQTLTRSIVDMD